MLDIVLAFFAVIGITFLLVHFFSFLYYRKLSYQIPLEADLRHMDKNEAIDFFELLSTVSHSSSGKALIGKVIVFLKEDQELTQEDVLRYFSIFDLEGEVLLVGNEVPYHPLENFAQREICTLAHFTDPRCE